MSFSFLPSLRSSSLSLALLCTAAGLALPATGVAQGIQVYIAAP